MSEWVVEVQNLIPQGQLAEFLMIARVDHVTGECQVMHAKMSATLHGGVYQIPESDSPLAAVGAAATDGKGINALLQALMDCAWKRGLRPSKFDPSAGELAAVKAHLEDMRKLAHSESASKIERSVANVGKMCADLLGDRDVTSDIGTDEKKIW